MSCGEEDSRSIKDDLQSAQDSSLRCDSSESSLHYDFSAWSSFRASCQDSPPAPRQTKELARADTLLVPFADAPERGDVGGGGAAAHGATREAAGEDVAASDVGPRAAASAARSSSGLTHEERRDNSAWRIRLMVGPTFGREYAPNKAERREMDGIIDFLALQDPIQNPEYLVRNGVERRCLADRLNNITET